MKKLLLFCLMLFFVTLSLWAQTYTYSASPLIGTYVSCPTACSSWLGGVVQIKATSINGSNFTFTLRKCDGSSFSTSGTFYIGWDTDMLCGNNPPTAYSLSVSISAGATSKDITVPASWFSNGNNSYWKGAYRSSNGTVYNAGTVTVTRTASAPVTPTGLVASAQSSSSIYLSWNASSGATSYDVYDCAGSYITNTSSTYYMVTGLSSGTWYDYKIKAINANGTSGFTACAGATTIAVAALNINPSGSISIGSTSGSGSISISSNASWTAVSDQSWLSITSGNSGSNNGIINYTYSSNGGTSSRSATITVSGSGVSSQTLTITQSGSALYLSISPSGTLSLSNLYGGGYITVSSNVSWTAASDQSWVAITSGASGTGNGTIVYSHLNNTTAFSRTAHIIVTGSGVGSQTLTLIQVAGSAAICFTPRMLIPPDNATDVATTAQFAWEGVPYSGATYELRIEDAGGNLIFSQTGITGTSFQLSSVNALVRGEVIHSCKVRALVGSSLTEWSPLQTFYTLKSNDLNTYLLGVPWGHLNNAIVYSNAGYYYGNYNYSSGVNTGLKWQCTEYVKRFFYQNNRLRLQPSIPGDASSYMGNAHLAGLRAVQKASNQLPQAGDILCWLNIQHVAIAGATQYISQGNYTLNAYQQNTPYNSALGYSMSVQQGINYHNVLYGNKHYQGFVTARPRFVAPTPVDGQTINTTTPTFAWEQMGADNYTVYIKEKDVDGCYQTYYSYSGSGHSFYLDPSHALNPGSEYMVRIVNHYPSGSFFNQPIYFSVNSSKSGVSDEVAALGMLINVKDGEGKTVEKADVYTVSNGEWEYRGQTQKGGGVYFSTFIIPVNGDAIIAEARGYLSTTLAITDSMIDAQYANLVMIKDPAFDRITSTRLTLLENQAETDLSVFTNELLAIKATAKGHQSFTLGIPDPSDESGMLFSTYSAADSIVSIVLHEGVNHFLVAFNGLADTVYDERTLWYYPIASIDDSCSRVAVIATPPVSGIDMFVDGRFVRKMTTYQEMLYVPQGTHRWAFYAGNNPVAFASTSSDTTLVLSVISGESDVEVNALNIYPNPATDKVIIAFPEAGQKNYVLRVLDIYGRNCAVYIEFRSDIMILDLTGLPRGVYFVEVRGLNVYSGKFEIL